ncbi:MAG: TIGR00296 family protein [Nitrososphaerales archaeon]
MIELSDEEGELLVKTARRAAEEYVVSRRRLKVGEEFQKRFNEKLGVFVTINTLKGKEHELRGCIGLVQPKIPLSEALIEAAISAATEDPRFEPIKPQELNNLIFEVSVLTPPERLKAASPKEYLNLIKIGRDGLIVEYRFLSGLLLPQVPVEEGWDVEQYLSYACMKAGAPPDIWLLPETKLYRFEAVVFAEEEPNGRVIRRRLV